MKLQFKFFLIFLLSMLISSVLTFIIIQQVLSVIDNQSIDFDLDRVSENIINEINELETFNEKEIQKILIKTQKNNRGLEPSFISIFSDNVINTDYIIKNDKIKYDFNKSLLVTSDILNNNLNNDYSLMSYYHNDKLFSVKLVSFKGTIEGILIIKINTKESLPFYITIHKEKIHYFYLLLLAMVLLTIIFTAIIIYLLVYRVIIKRLIHINNKVKTFELGKTTIHFNDNGNDEISSISKTLEIGTKGINKIYNEKIEAFRERHELIKNISHDFRNPLTSILGYAVFLDEDLCESEELKRKYYKIIRNKSEYMAELFTEMLELSRLDTSTYLLKKTSFDISELIREILINYVSDLEKLNFNIETDFPENLFIEADLERLTKVFKNLIDDIIKYASSGKYLGIFIRETEHKRIIITFKDKGEGIEKHEMEKIFTRFHHGHESSQSGTGLGLSLSKEIIEKHRGKLNIESEIGKGTSFIIEIPVK